MVAQVLVGGERLAKEAVKGSGPDWSTAYQDVAPGKRDFEYKSGHERLLGRRISGFCSGLAGG